MLATSKISLMTRRLKKNGKYPVKIRIIWQREKHFYSAGGTDLTEDEFANLHVRKNLKRQFDDIMYFLKKADNIIDDLSHDFTWKEFDDRYYNRQKAVATVLAESSSINLIKQIQNYGDNLIDSGSVSSGMLYRATANHLIRFVGKEKEPCILFTEVTPEYLFAFEKYLLSPKVGLTYSSVGVYMRNIRAVFNQVIAKKIISSDIYPFGKNKYMPPASKKAKKALPMVDIEKIYNYKSLDPNSTEAWAKDMWIFTYLGNGMNVKDIALLKYSDIDFSKKFFRFIRAKTKNTTKNNIQYIEVAITKDMERIIQKWGNPINKNSYVFPILHPEDLSPVQVRRDVNQAVKRINKYMKRIGKELDFDELPTSNFARHSFSTVLKRAGVPIEMISEQLGHTSIKTTQIYLDSFETEQKKEITKHLTAFKKSE